MNPVLRREMRTLLRTFRTFLAMMAYVGVLTLVAFGFLQAAANENYNSVGPMTAIYLYWVLAAFQTGLTLMIAAVFAGSAISGERERQTLDLMLVTPMTHGRIIIGKLCASLLLVLMMVVASLPVFSLLLYYGGMSFANLLALIAYTLLMAAMSGSIAIFFSAWTKKTILSIVLSGIVLGLMTVGNIVTFVSVNFIFYNDSRFGQPAFWLNKLILGANPGAGLFSLMDDQYGSGTVNQMMTDMAHYDTAIYDTFFFKLPLWAITCLFAIAVTALCLFGAARCLSVNKKAKPWGAAPNP